MNTIEIQHAFREIQELWPLWDPPHTVRGILAKRFRGFRPDCFHEAIEEVACTYSSRQPPIAWFFKAYERVRKHQAEAMRGDREEAKRIAEAKLQREVDEGRVMMTEQLRTLPPDALERYRDRVNAMGIFGQIGGTDIDAWTPWQRGLVWARWRTEEPPRSKYPLAKGPRNDNDNFDIARD